METESASNSASSNEIPPPLSAQFHESFAYMTIKDRLPIILTKVIDSLHRDRHVIGEQLGEEAQEETKSVIHRLSQLRNEMVTNKPILPLINQSVDVPLWNNYLNEQQQLYGFEPAWFDSPWLYAECYLYRRIKEAFELSMNLQSYDPFHYQKESAFISSVDMAILLATMLQEAIDDLNSNKSATNLYEHFVKFVEMSLWGNKCDLSLAAGKEQEDDSTAASSFAQLGELRKNILVNDTDIFWTIIQSANKNHQGFVRMDLVVDNAGYELFTDLCLLEFLESAGLISSVYFYVKVFPWFVSDTLLNDFQWLISTLVNHETEILARFGKRWKNKIEKKTWIIEEHNFWTLPHDFSEMKVVDPALYEQLSKSDVVLFKGDLNYRKLVSDRQWKVDVPFVTSLRGFQPAPICSLRTIKADVVTGLNNDVKEELDKKCAQWMNSGEYAVIQCVPLDS